MPHATKLFESQVAKGNQKPKRDMPNQIQMRSRGTLYDKRREVAMKQFQFHRTSRERQREQSIPCKCLQR